MAEWKETHPKPTEDQLLIKNLREVIKQKEKLILDLQEKNSALEIELAQLRRFVQHD